LKKVLFISRSFESFYGAEKSMFQIIDSLNNMEKTLLIPGNSPLEVEAKKRDIKIIKYDFLIQIKAPISFIKKSFSTFFLIKRECPDIIYANRHDTLLVMGFVFFLLKLSFSKIKIINHLREHYPLTFKHKIFLQFVDEIFLNTTNMGKDLLPKFFLKKTKLLPPLISYNDKIEFVEFNKKKSWNIAYIGRISNWKGQKRFMEIILDGIENNYLNKNYTVHFFGNTCNDEEVKYEKDLKKFIKDNNLSNLVKFYGYVKNIHTYLPDMDVVVFLTSMQESAGRIMVEGAIHGIPYIVENIEQLKVYTLNYSGGISVNKKQNKSVIDALNLLTNKDVYILKQQEMLKLIDARCESKESKNNINLLFNI